MTRLSPNLKSQSAICYLPFAICHLLLALCLASCGRPDEAWERVRASGTVRVGMDASFPPFETITVDGALVGFDVDVGRELGQRLGVEVQFIANLPYDGLYDALAVGRVDAAISALVVNPARMADFAYSDSYFDAGQVLVVREGERDIEGMADLAERTLAVEFGSQGDMEARKWARRLAGLAVMPYQTAAEALAAVAAGETEAALVDHVSALAAGAQPGTAVVGLRPSHASGMEDRLVIRGEPVVREPYAIAVRRESHHLLRAINEALAEMEADGVLEAFRKDWLAAPALSR